MQKQWGLAVAGLILATMIPATHAAGPIWGREREETVRHQQRFASAASGPSAVGTGIAITLSGPAQYSDRLMVTASLTRAGGAPVSGAPLQFALGATPIGVAVTDAQGKATLDWLTSVGAGVYPLTVSYAGDPHENLAPSSWDSSLTVLPETAVVRTDGPEQVWTAGGSSLRVSTTIAEEADRFYGRLDAAAVSFRVLDQSRRVVAEAVTPVVAAGDGTGTATASIPMLPEGLYTVQTEVRSRGLYLAAQEAETPVRLVAGKLVSLQ